MRSAEIDERLNPGEGAEAYVRRLAVEKAEAVMAQMSGEGPATILAADTAVVTEEGTILGKPLDGDDAARMLHMLSGRTHSVMTGVCILSSLGARVSGVETTHVSFIPLTAKQIAAYVATMEPMDKAGAYAIQGYAARWIPRIIGDYSNVVGLPLARTVAMLEEAQNQDQLCHCV